jgi:hypothetical protein
MNSKGKNFPGTSHLSPARSWDPHHTYISTPSLARRRRGKRLRSGENKQTRRPRCRCAPYFQSSYYKHKGHSFARKTLRQIDLKVALGLIKMKKASTLSAKGAKVKQEPKEIITPMVSSDHVSCAQVAIFWMNLNKKLEFIKRVVQYTAHAYSSCSQ